MNIFNHTRLWSLTLLSLLNVALSWSVPVEARKKGFVDIHEVDQTIQISPRYCSEENFVGKKVDGYKKPIIMLTQQAAQALKKVQEEVSKDGYSLVIYDAYRPKQAVTHFVRWSKDVGDQAKKSHYYPYVDKTKVFELGYVGEPSSHSRGSTVDLTLIKKGQKIHQIEEKKCALRDSSIITKLDDGTVDMGCSFDYFGPASHYDNDLISQECKNLRIYLKNVMEKHGFKDYPEEWWHFTLKNEPYPADNDSSYFNFPVE